VAVKFERNHGQPVVAHQLLPNRSNTLLLLSPSLNVANVRVLMKGLMINDTSIVPLNDLCRRSFSILSKE
jgi:hypothetical protein